MYERFRSDPSSVSPNWQEFFADYRSATGNGGSGPAAAPSTPVAAPTPAAAPQPPATQPVPEAEGEPIRGAGAAIVANMERSLGVPTATSFRDVPAQLLQLNLPALHRLL